MVVVLIYSIYKISQIESKELISSIFPRATSRMSLERIRSQTAAHTRIFHFEMLQRGVDAARQGGSKESAYLIAIYPEQSLFLPSRRGRASQLLCHSTSGNDRFSRRPACFRREKDSTDSILFPFVRRKEGCLSSAGRARPGDSLQGAVAPSLHA